MRIDNERTRKHDADVVRELDHPGATPPNRARRALRYVRRHERTDHTHAQTREKSTRIQSADLQ